MTITSARRAALSCALLATTAFCGLTAQPAAAQSNQAAYRNFDANGVDLARGDYLFSFTEGSVGSGPATLSLVRQVGSAAGGASQWDGLRFRKTAPYAGGPETVEIAMNNRVERFTASGGGWTSSLAMGNELSGGGGSFSYRTRDGTGISFGDPTGNAMGGATNFCKDGLQTLCELVPTVISSPNGGTVSLGWTTADQCGSWFNPDGTLDCTYFWRLQSVSNSYGYAIGFAYAGDAANQGEPGEAWLQRTGATFSRAGAAQGQVSYVYPANGVVDVRDMGGRVWQVSNGYIRRPGAGSNTVAVTSNSQGTVAAVTRDGVTTNYARSVSGNMATMTVTNALNQPTTVVSDLSHGLPTAITDALGRTSGYQYDPNGRLLRATAPEGNSVENLYDARGNVTQVLRRDKSGDPSRDIVTSATYAESCTGNPSCNQPLTTTDARGQTTRYSYDPDHGRVTAVTLPAASDGKRPETRYSYTDSHGEYQLTGVSACQTQTSCAGTADEVKTVMAYDTFGNTVAVTTGDGTGALSASQAMAYDGKGDPLWVDGPLPGESDRSHFLYNAARELVIAASPDPDGGGPLKPRATRNLIDPASGMVTAAESGTLAGPADWGSFNPLERVETGYDIHFRPVSRKAVDAQTGTAHAFAQTRYDTLGRPECTAQRMDLAAAAAPLTDACLQDDRGTRVHGPDRITRNVYDALGRVEEVHSGVGTPEAARDVRQQYRPNGQVETATDANGNVTTYAYDGHDRLRQTTYPATGQHGATSDTLTYESINGGVQNSPLVASVVNRAGETIAFDYDALGRVTVKDVPNSTYVFDNFFRYDHFGRVTWIGQDAASPLLGFSYDALGRVTQENHTSFGAKSFGYDLAGRRTHMTWRDGFRIDYGYLVTGEMKTIAENPAAMPGAITLATFDYDDRGNRTKLTRGNGTVTDYTSDAVSRLQTLAQRFPASRANDLTLGFAYNPAGQIVTNERSNTLYSWAGATPGTTASTPNALNQIANSNFVNFSYDAKGNLTSDGTRSYSYDAENRLKSAGTRDLYYDVLGRLTWHFNGGTLFDHEGSRLVTELRSSTYAILRRFVHGPGSDEPLVWYEGTGTSDRRWLHADERGSIVAHSDAGGAVTARLTYDEYGNPAATNVGRFQYTGQKWFDALGLYDYKARAYDPRLGRFLQPDPIGYRDGMNRYAYVGADPVNLADPSGMSAEDFDETDVLQTGDPRKDEPDLRGALSFDGMGHVGMIVGGRLSALQFEREQAALRFALGRLNSISADTGIAAECLLSKSCAAVHLAGQPAGATGKVRAGALPWDPRHEAALYKPSQAELAAVRGTFGALRDQLKTGYYSNRKIGMKTYFNTGRFAFLPSSLGTYYEAKVFINGVAGLRRIVVDSKNLGILWYSPEHYRYFIPIVVVPAR